MNIIDHVTASLYEVPRDQKVDLLVNPEDAQSIQDILIKKGYGRKFTVIQSDAIALGHMVVVDKLGILTGLDLR